MKEKMKGNLNATEINAFKRTAGKHTCRNETIMEYMNINESVTLCMEKIILFDINKEILIFRNYCENKSKIDLNYYAGLISS